MEMGAATSCSCTMGALTKTSLIGCVLRVTVVSKIYSQNAIPKTKYTLLNDMSLGNKALNDGLHFFDDFVLHGFVDDWFFVDL